MADKVDKPKKQKSKGKPDEKGVLAALPSTRPERIGTRRAAPAPKSTATTAASRAATSPATEKPAAKQPKAAAESKTAAKPRATAQGEPAAKPRATAASKPAAKPRAAAKSAAKPRATAKSAAKPRATAKSAPKPRTTATRRKAAAPRTFEPTGAAEAAAGAADERTAGAVPRGETPPVAEAPTYPRPRPVSEGAPGIGSGYRDAADEESGRPSSVELAVTAVRAAGEVAQLGLAVGGEVLKGVVKRLPRL